MSYLDTRDLIARFEELEAELTDAKDSRSELEAELDLSDWCEAVSGEVDFPMADVVAEFRALQALLEDLKGSGGDEQWRGDWYPVTLIPEHSFIEYAQELAEECGMVNESATWPNNCIDWERAARELQMDYSSVEYDGNTYLYRS